jgi:RNA polymerase sigma-70 factor, ECF subfamily
VEPQRAADRSLPQLGVDAREERTLGCAAPSFVLGVSPRARGVCLPHDEEGAARDRIFGLVYRQMRQLAAHRDVDELVQIAAEQAMRSLASFEGRSELATWTFRICYLTVLKHARWHRRWLRRFRFTDDGELPESPTDAPNSDECLEQKQRGERLRAALTQLSPKRRAVIILHDLDGLSVDEIAPIVAATPAAVRSRLRDARDALRQVLADDPYFGNQACARRG